MGTWQTVFLPAAFGSAIQELAYWYQLRFKLSSKKYQQQMRAIEYWVIVALMVVGSGIGTMFWVATQVPAPKDCMVLGAAFPLIFKHAFDAAAGKRPHLGDRPVEPDEGSWNLRSYFGMR